MDRPRRAQNHHHDRGQPYNDPSHDENLKRHRRGLIIPENFTFRVLPDLRKILTAARASEHGNISRKNSDNDAAIQGLAYQAPSRSHCQNASQTKSRQASEHPQALLVARDRPLQWQWQWEAAP